MVKKLQAGKYSNKPPLKIVNANTGVLSVLVEVLEEFRDLDEHLNISALQVFLLICQQEGISNSDIEKTLEMHKARVSRSIQMLCTVFRGRKSNEGLSLIEMRINPEDYRYRKIYLTEKGKSVRNRIVRLLG